MNYYTDKKGNIVIPGTPESFEVYIERIYEEHKGLHKQSFLIGALEAKEYFLKKK